MTLGKGKRISNACLRCRRRKTKCSLGDTGESIEPPCKSCRQANAECKITKSRRGTSRWGVRKRNAQEPANAATPADSAMDSDLQRPAETRGVDLGDGTRTERRTTSVQHVASTQNCRESVHGSNVAQPHDDEDEDDLHMELRNPSDALQILSHVREDAEDIDMDQQECHNRGFAPSVPHSAQKSNVTMDADNASAPTLGVAVPHNVLDDYELVQRGLIPPSVIPELLYTFASRYHRFCPITPPYMLGAGSMSKIQRTDYFLLTVILTIASRDSAAHTLTHRYCWDHTERLLLGVVLAHRSAQTSRTVQALLLLAEWLPYQTKGETSTASTALLQYDQSAWSIIGLAVRQAYLLRMDRAAFLSSEKRHPNATDEEEKRLIWTYVYLADRQISVRMGQSFWSRGPSLSSTLRARDFPALKPLPASDDGDLALALEAHLQLTQVLYNAHGILYSSAERTLAMVNAGDYSRYLDDFQRAVLNWNATWKDIQVSSNVKTTLMIVAEYVSLYVNAFSFQAVLTRATAKMTPGNRRNGENATTSLFPGDLMISPDGPYVYEAVSSARKLLSLFENPQETLRYLPTRYYLYGVYAAVFLHKAQRAGVFKSPDQVHENFLAAQKFICGLEQISSDEFHLCRRYSAMLRRIWQRQGAAKQQGPTRSPRQTRAGSLTGDPAVSSIHTIEHSGGEAVGSQVQGSNSLPQHADQREHPFLNDGEVGLGSIPSLTQDEFYDATTFNLEDYLVGSFFPGIMDMDFHSDQAPGTQLY